ncbi:MAG: T9SS type A sorting domain-containing protein, partial [Chitinophagaceae bacterium]|nr:T9SS type A sorting domain-containing protein [Chitinophagaceae bacterium]
CGLLLPVDLLSFTAAYKEQKVLLKWSIDRADGLSHFIIERSTDGGNSFSEAGRMDWHNGVNEYQFADDVSSFDGRLQYRLRIADLNAVYKYSPVVMVTLPATDALFVLTPNPSSGKLQLVFREVNNLEWKISVIDLAGKINYSSVLQQGQSVYNLPDMMLPSGVYILRLQHDRSLQQVKFIIQR